MGGYDAVIVNGNTRTLLSAVLQRIECIIAEGSHVGVFLATEADYAAFFMQFIENQLTIGHYIHR